MRSYGGRKRQELKGSEGKTKQRSRKKRRKVRKMEKARRGHRAEGGSKLKKQTRRMA